jgi:hypothetical protein
VYKEKECIHCNRSLYIPEAERLFPRFFTETEWHCILAVPRCTVLSQYEGARRENSVYTEVLPVAERGFPAICRSTVPVRVSVVCSVYTESYTESSAKE